jgi:hypothetical protein
LIKEFWRAHNIYSLCTLNGVVTITQRERKGKQ